MKLFCAVACLALFSHTAVAGDWKLVWSDEFDKPGMPDPAKWNFEQGSIRNREAQYYTKNRSENARVVDGMLIIEARKEQFPNPAYDPNAPEGSRHARRFAEYTSASLTTQDRANWTYGRIEVRAKLPPGKGTWPAIWTLGTNAAQVGWPACGEIDIMEFVGFDPGIIHANIHTRKYNHVKKTGKGSQITIPDCGEAFHVYALEWDSQALSFFVDDKKYFTYSNEGSGVDAWPYDAGQFLILNLAIGGDWGGAKGIDESAFPQKYYIDYVRVYQRSK